MHRLGASIGSARVDLNPHQVEAALFALRSPFAKGVLLADEVGLGKTIEAGIVLAQCWAEGSRQLLLIVPATLRKQWQSELETKFGLPTRILDGPAVRQALQTSPQNPLAAQDAVLIVSYPFAAAYSHLLEPVRWQAVVLDEAHRLRNVYQPGNKQANAIKAATRLAQRRIMLTATPLQNSLLELYGLVSFLDEHAFGNLDSFREQYLNGPATEACNAALRQRLQAFCKRTLRRDVQEYVRFTRRLPLTQAFHPSNDEQALYEAVSVYLQRDALYALPNSQRALLTLVLRKLLASSSFAIAATLRRLQERVAALAAAAAPPDVFPLSEYDTYDELRDEWPAEAGRQPATGTAAELAAELVELQALTAQAEAIAYNQKGTTLLRALPTAFAQSQARGAARKAVIFTESRRTQQYLRILLEANGYAGEVVCINGSNADAHSQQLYRRWQQAHPTRVSGAKTADVKAAIVEHFRIEATILLAAESAAEGVNLQFCSLVVNYDLPWNPQRVEQRIGRCHRYGQQHDVVVVNFLNERNAADQRVFELLSEKFKLFEGVFGVSDEILGALLTGVDLERRIADIYQYCRTNAEIQAGFDNLRAELDGEIQDRMRQTRRSVLDHLDGDVHERLKIHYDQARALLDQRQQTLWALARHELRDTATFEPDTPRFDYHGPAAPPGPYHLDWREAERLGDGFFAPGTAFADSLLLAAQTRPLPLAHLQLHLSAHPVQLAQLQPLVGQTGWLTCARLQFEAATPAQHLLLAGCMADGSPLPPDLARKLLELAARPGPLPAPERPAELARELGRQVAACRQLTEAHNARYFGEEADKLDRWADDLKLGLEAELKNLDRDIREAHKTSRAGATLAEKLDGQKQLRNLASERATKRRRLYEAQDEIDQQRNALIDKLEEQLQLRETLLPIFTLAWTVV